MASLPPQSTTPGRIRSTTSRDSNSEHNALPQETSSYTATSSSETEDRESSSEPVFPRSPAQSTSFAGIEVEDITDTNKEAENPDTVNGTDAAGTSSSNIAASAPNHPDENEPKKCWICYSDETEDTPLNSEWRSPCPCALSAHEACLLDWLADLENPKSRRYSGRSAKMHCPQCKSEIVIARPRSLIVEMLRRAERLAGRLVLPGVLFTLAGTVWAGCCAHGVYSMYLIFGTQETKRILEAGTGQPWNPRMNLGLPTIPLTLIFSRTRYAESLLPAIPVIFFATHRPGEVPLDLDMWPPSASVTFAVLPYAKSFYNLLYEWSFGKLERKWIAEVQPRAGESEGNGQAGQDGHQNEDNQVHDHMAENEGEVLMEIGLELELGMGDGDEPPVAIQAVARGGDNQPAGAQVEGQEGNQEGAPANQILGRRQHEIIQDTSNIADTVLGALLFPAISAGMGGLLKFTLPKSWTTAPASLEKGRAGFFQTKWGRSVVGGCLFVLLKDALVLYCRWKLAQTHRKRRVLNYDRVKKRVVDP
ncbi:conserved hypothetical protein [Uncinocarpus reesii 1704]|uniref:RING-CH-type domain-containing protein n=1 Tax=Uncinocarpus reesii (strain UAMH 1704) TaxID=336963 RepID=C4JYW3_UNCRE|nr:uncharacterized protein UREG_07364 [Uncinocarpus reesii 1704]EEP82499.1 conserved hypothetical protein [Uncinocarpus reesii 1704]